MKKTIYIYLVISYINLLLPINCFILLADNNIENEYDQQLTHEKYQPSIQIKLNVNQTATDSEKQIKEKILIKIKNTLSNHFKDNHHISKKYLKNQFANSHDKKNAISMLELYYDELVKGEEIKRKKFKTNYALLNQKLSEKLTELNNQINELEGKIENIRKLNDNIEAAKREKQTLKEKIQTNRNAIISEKQMLKGDLESQSTYGIFAVTIENQGRSFDLIDKTLQDIFENISLKTLSEVFLHSENKMQDGLIVKDTINSKLSGIISMTGSRDIYRGFEMSVKIQLLKLLF